MERAEHILKAVQAIHEAALTADGWTRALPFIAAAVASNTSYIFFQDSRTHAVESISGHDVPTDHVDIFASMVTTAMPRWGPTLPQGLVTPSSAMMADDEFAKSDFYNEAVRPVGDFYGLVVAPIRSPGHSVYLVHGRARGRDDYDAVDVDTMRTLAPHIAAALRTGERLALARLHAEAFDAALERLETGVIIVNAASRILFANTAAQAILRDCGSLGAVDGVIGSRNHRADRTLRSLIAGCANAGSRMDGSHGGTLELPGSEGRDGFLVDVAPFRDADAAFGFAPARAQNAAIVTIIRGGQQQHARKENLRLRFGLTPAEAAVALEIAKGDGRAAAASRLGVSLTTVRTHLSQVFEKTGSRRQAELVRLLTDPVPFKKSGTPGEIS